MIRSILIGLCLCPTLALSNLSDLLISEIVTNPEAGEYLEIHNKGSQVIDLTDVYITDATFAPNTQYYYKIVTNDLYGGGGFFDFHARFPAGASILPGEFQTIALNGAADFSSIYATNPTYELYDDGSGNSVADMREAVNGSINGQGGLTDSGEVLVLYHWDGQSDLVQDLDYVLWGDKNEAIDKSLEMIDGPDAGTQTSTYLSETSIGNQSVIDTGAHANGFGWSRIDFSEGTEITSGGNGFSGSDETSENLDETFAQLLPSPNGATATVPLLINEVDAVSSNSEFVEIYDGGIGNLNLDGYYLAFFDAATNQAYRVVDLSGSITSADGYLLVGNSAVSPDITLPDSSISDGAAAVAVYDMEISMNSAVTTNGLQDALVYDSGQADATTLLSLLNSGQAQINENNNGTAASQSNARCSNGTGGQRNTDTFTQTDPTPGFTNNLCPIGDYYASVDTSSSEQLRLTLHEIIDEHTEFPYSSSQTDTWDVLSFADEDPSDPSLVWMIYKNNSYTWQGGGQQAYNREHTWPQSYGFSSGALGDDNPARTDMHHLMLSDVGYNSDRGNLYFDNCDATCASRATDANNGVGGTDSTYPGDSNWFDNNSWEVWSFRKGDIARAMFYMDVRYNGDQSDEVDLELTDNPNEIQNNQPKMGLLSVLLQWHEEDPVDAIELERMERIFSFQNNRNPFIDHPEWVACVFSDICPTVSDVIFANGFEN